MGIAFEIEPILTRVGLADTDLCQSYQFGFAVSPAKMLLNVTPTVLFLDDLDAGWSRPRGLTLRRYGLAHRFQLPD